MMTHLKSAAIVALAAILLNTGVMPQRAAAENKRPLPENVKTALEKSATFELYSLQPEEAAEGFHGWKVLGATKVQDDATRKKVVEAVAKAVADSDGSLAKCFQPRHAIRVTHDGKNIDLVICFECSQIHAYVGTDKEPKVISTTEHAQALLDKVLAAAKVPLADKPKQ